MAVRSKKILKPINITLPQVMLNGYMYFKSPKSQGDSSSSKTIYVPHSLPDGEYLVILIPKENVEEGGNELHLDF